MSAALETLGGCLFQVAYVVPDLSAAERFFASALGVRHFERLAGVELGEGCTHRGARADASLDLAIGYAGDTQIELVYPARGASIHREFLDAGRSGLHHLGFLVDDFAGATASLRAQGLTCVAEGLLETGMRVEFAYFDATAQAGSVLEILAFDAAARAFMNGIQQKGRSAS